MRRVDRSARPAPSSLTGEGSAGGRELVKARDHFGRVPPPETAFSFRAYKGDDVRSTLEALFHGKCAYCETRYEVSGPVDIEHFRPKKGVEDDETHPGYWWFAGTWANLLPSCLDCNRRRYQPTPASLSSLSAVLEGSRRGFSIIKTGKETCFPIQGVRMTAEPSPADMLAALQAEAPLLLDPCLDDPAQFIRFHIDRDEPLGVVFATSDGSSPDDDLPLLSEQTREVERHARDAGISPRGAVSIQVYGLNRLALVQERTRLLRRLEFLADTVIELSRTADDLEELHVSAQAKPKITEAVLRLRAHVDRTLAEIKTMAAPDAPFSTMVSEWLAVFTEDVARKSGGATGV
jgi:hypothetical protein